MKEREANKLTATYSTYGGQRSGASKFMASKTISAMMNLSPCKAGTPGNTG
jgi:hypothetical protein